MTAALDQQKRWETKFKFHLERAVAYYAALAEKKAKKMEEFIAKQRRLYAEGSRSKWKIKRLEQIPGWTWTEEQR